jgi:hypothetical protein
MHTERWAPIPGHAGYDVSDKGRVRSWWHRRCQGPALRDGVAMVIGDNFRVLRLGCTPNGYTHVHLRRVTRLVHALVLEAFVGPRPKGQQCRHLDGNRQNNSLENLAWGTCQENAADRDAHGTSVYVNGERHGMAKLTEPDVLAVRKLLALPRSQRPTQVAIAKRFRIDPSTVSNIKTRKLWAHLECGP